MIARGQFYQSASIFIKSVLEKIKVSRSCWCGPVALQGAVLGLALQHSSLTSALAPIIVVRPILSLPPLAVVLVEGLDVEPDLIAFPLGDSDLFLQLVVGLELRSLLLDKKCPRQINFFVRGRSSLRSFEASLQEFRGITR